MPYDEIYKLSNYENTIFRAILIDLSIDKNMCLIQLFDENINNKKKYLRGLLILIDDYILTSRYADTVHFMEELKLFDVGNDHNKYLDIKEYKNTKNLKLKWINDKDIFISKAEAKAIYKIYDLSFKGYSTSVLLEDEFKLSSQQIIKILHENKLLLK